MIDEVALRRFNRSETAGSANVEGALNACLAEHEKEKFKSVYIIAVREHEEGPYDHWTETFMAGPHVSTLRRLWMVLQAECLWLIERMSRED